MALFNRASKSGLLRLSLGALLLLQPAPLIAQNSAARVEIETVRAQPVFRKVELSGTVTSPGVSPISTSVEGLVSDVLFDSGATVKRGELLVLLDNEVQEAALRQSQAQVAQSIAELADAKRRLKIAEDLASRSYGPKNEVEARLAEVEIDTAALANSRANEARAKAVLDRHKLKAPFDGIISKKMVEVGQWVEPGTAVFELVAMGNFRVDVPVPQQYFVQLKQGAEVSIIVDALPDRVLPATIDVLIPVSDPDARTFTLRVLPKNKNLPITPGMSARVAVSIATGDTNVVVSRDALIRYPDGRVTIWVLERNGEQELVKERNIEIGLAFDGVVQVVKGLKEGERVVVRGNESLREGQEVQLAS